MQENSGQGNRKRLFIALNVPGPVSEKLEQAQETLKSLVRPGAVKWVNPEQIHLTLRFLGGVSEQDVHELRRSLEAACEEFPPLTLEVAGIGFFPRRGSPRVIWAGVGGDNEALSRLHQSIERSVSRFSPEPGEAHIHGHVTLGRVKSVGPTEVNQLLEAAKAMSNASFGRWEASKVLLVQSQLAPKGSIYTVVFEAPLRNGGV